MAEISGEQNEDNLENKIQIFSNTDEKLKFLGKILNNDSSREILQLLIEKEMTANEIATQTKSSLPLALYHVNQMIKAGVVIVSKTSTNGKNQPIKYYSAKLGIVILPEKASQKAKESKSFSKSLKSIMKFTVVGIAAITAWFGTQQKTVVTITDTEILEQNYSAIRSIDPSFSITSFVIVGVVILCGLFLIYYSKKEKKR